MLSAVDVTEAQLAVETEVFRRSTKRSTERFYPVAALTSMVWRHSADSAVKNVASCAVSPAAGEFC